MNAHLCCPVCGGPLYQSHALIVCQQCAADWPVDHNTGIPLFAPKEASDPGFNHRWRKHPAPQPTPPRQFIDKTGWMPEHIEGKVFLDAGCGIGRYCRFAKEHGAQAVIGVDISPQGLTAARENAPGTYLAQADLLHRLPVADESVDMAISIGVLHHTANPKQSFMNVARTVKKGGQLAIWVYCNPATDKSPATLQAIDFFHEITRACPPDVLYDIIARHAVAIRDTNHPAWGQLQQVIRPSYNPSDEQCISDMFDWHTPRYRFWHTQDEVDSWFQEAGFDVTWRGAFPVSASGVKR